MSNLVSVIIPCYNAEKYLDMSIGSIYEQDYPNVELIVVNDDSTDNSEEKIVAWQEKFAQKGYVLKYFKQDNQGQAAATSLGLKHVTGEYLTLLDADDRYLQGALSLKAKFLDEHPECCGVRNNGYTVRDSGRTEFIRSEEEKEITDLFTALSLGKTYNWAGSYMIRTSILFDFYKDRNILPSRSGQNFQILLPVAYKRNFGYIDVPLMEYYIYDNSHSHALDPEKQYILGEKNSAGWREIYFNVLDRLVKDPKEYKKYENMYNSVYYRGALYRAAANLKKDRMVECFGLLKKTGRMNLDDRVVYYSVLKSPKVLFWKVLCKGKAILTKK